MQDADGPLAHHAVSRTRRLGLWDSGSLSHNSHVVSSLTASERSGLSSGWDRFGLILHQESRVALHESSPSEWRSHLCGPLLFLSDMSPVGLEVVQAAQRLWFSRPSQTIRAGLRAGLQESLYCELATLTQSLALCALQDREPQTLRRQVLLRHPAHTPLQ